MPTTNPRSLDHDELAKMSENHCDNNGHRTGIYFHFGASVIIKSSWTHFHPARRVQKPQICYRHFPGDCHSNIGSIYKKFTVIVPFPVSIVLYYHSPANSTVLPSSLAGGHIASGCTSVPCLFDTDAQPESIWPPKPEMLISLELRQTGSANSNGKANGLLTTASSQKLSPGYYDNDRQPEIYISMSGN